MSCQDVCNNVNDFRKALVATNDSEVSCTGIINDGIGVADTLQEIITSEVAWRHLGCNTLLASSCHLTMKVRYLVSLAYDCVFYFPTMVACSPLP